MSKKKDTHESFGLVQFSRRQSAGTRALFGSSLTNHGTTVALKIYTATREHDLSEDWYYPEENLIEVELSAAQFAQLLTTMNYGSGVPCTIRRFNGGGVEDPPLDKVRTEADEIRKSFDERVSGEVESIVGRMEKIEEIVSSARLSQKAKKEILHEIKIAKSHLRANMPFFVEQFQRAAERTVSAAKAEVDAFLTTAIQKTGLKALKDMGTNLLLSGNGEDE